jgi:hypothetical protein
MTECLSALLTHRNLLPRNIIILMFLVLISVSGWVNLRHDKFLFVQKVNERSMLLQLLAETASKHVDAFPSLWEVNSDLVVEDLYIARNQKIHSSQEP